MSRTALIYRVNDLPTVFAPCALYISKTSGGNFYDLFLTSTDGSAAERIITESDVDAALNARSNIPNGIVKLDPLGAVPVAQLPNIPSSKISGLLSVGVTGNSATSSRLQNSRTINGVAFDGTQNITVNAVDVTARIAVSQRGAINGVASLDAGGLVPLTQLPSFVDDVLEFASLSAFPTTGETGKIYVARDTNKTYRWSGSVYIFITSGAVDSVSGKTGVVVLNKSDVGLSSVDDTSDLNKPVSTAQQTAINTAQASAIAASTPVSHVGSGGAAHTSATVSSAGFMSAADKLKLDTVSGLNTGDQVNISGNAGTASSLQTPRNINGVAFNGTQDIVIQSLPSRVDGQDTSLKTANDAFVWGQMTQAFSVRNTSSNNPSFGVIFGIMQGLLFSDNNNQHVWVDFIVPNNHAAGTPMVPRIHWMPTTNNSGSVQWGIDYCVAKRDAIMSTTVTSILVTQSVPSNSRYRHFVTELPIENAIAASLLEPDTVIKMRIYRNANSSADNLSGTVHAWKAVMQYQIGQIGTKNRTPNHFT